MKPGALSAVLLAVLWLPAGAEIYKCLDAAGAVQYSDRPCAGQGTVISPAVAPLPDDHVAGRRRRADKLLRAYEAERAEQARLDAEALAARRERERNCARARDLLVRTSHAGRLYRIGEDGSKVDLNEAEHAELQARARAAVAHWCE